ncbi:MAG: hypothetical protein ACOCP8_06500, partial [archaeon]
NIVNKTSSVGFDLKGISPKEENKSSKIIVTNNYIYNTYLVGVTIRGDDDVNKDDETGSDDYGFATSSIIQNNIIEKCNRSNEDGEGSVGDAGILLKRLGKNIKKLSNNLISNYGRGIYVFNETSADDLDEDAISKNIIIKNNECINNNDVGIKVDAIPGRLMRFILYASVEGVYYGQCSELCGVNHAFMPICIEIVKSSYFID